MKKFLDADHPFFAARWRRWATTVLPMLWGGIELWLGSPGWAVLFVAAGAWAGYELLFKGPAGN